MVGRPKIDIERLKVYLSQDLSQREIANKLGCHRTCIAYWRKKLNWPSKNIRARAQFEKLWRNGTAISDIMSQLNISRSTVSKWYRRLKLPMRESMLHWRRRKQLELSEKCYRMRRLGVEDEDISHRLEIELRRVKELIGFAIMRRCQITPSCPYKPLLPENKPLSRAHKKRKVRRMRR